MFKSTRPTLHFYCVVYLAVVIYLSQGCAGPTTIVQRSQDLSTSGIRYADTMNDLLEETINRVVDFDSTEALLVRERSQEDSLRSLLDARNEALALLVNEMSALKRHTQLLKVYFLNLQQLTNASAPADMGAAVQDLSASIQEANVEIRRKEAIRFSESEQKEIGNLGNLMAMGIHAAKIQTALRRDATIIGEQLLLHEKLLKTIAEILQDRFEVENDQFYREKVMQPYTHKETSIGSQWKKDRYVWLTSQFIVENLHKAEAASQQLYAMWKIILEGGEDPGTLTPLLQDINSYISSIRVIDEAINSTGGGS